MQNLKDILLYKFYKSILRCLVLTKMALQVFSGNNDQENAVVKLLCEWAVSPERTGEHRALAVAALLDRRQSDTAASSPADHDGTIADDKDSNVSVPGGPPMFQSLLMKFLDTDAPVPAPDDCPQVVKQLQT